MPSQLEREFQSDFGDGSQPDVAAHLIEENAALRIYNGLLDEHGLIYRRGGATYLTTNDLVQPGGGRWLWDGYVGPNLKRTIFSTAGALCNLAVDGTTAQEVITPGTTPGNRAVVEGMLFIPGTPSHIYGGSQEDADKTAQTVGVTNDSAIVTGTALTTDLDIGMIFQIGSERVYTVKSIESAASLTLTEDYEGSTDASATADFHVFYPITASDPYRASLSYAAGGGRLIAIADNKMYFAGRDLVTGVSKPHTWDSTDFHSLPDGNLAFEVRGQGQGVLLFATHGVWWVSNIALELTDAQGNLQHRFDQVSDGISLWGRGAIAGWLNTQLIPARDGIYSMDTVSTPRPLQGSIRQRYQRYVELGYQPGGAAVYRDHYFLPILDTTGSTVDTLVSRLDRPIEIAGERGFPWTFFDRNGAQNGAYALKHLPGGGDRLLAAQNLITGRLLDCSTYFNPSGAVKADPDGSVHECRIETRDFATGELTENRVRRLRAHFDLLGDEADDPRVVCEYAVGGRDVVGSKWGQMIWGVDKWTDLTDTSYIHLDDDYRLGQKTPHSWWVNKMQRFIRFRLRNTGACAQFKVRHLEIFIAPNQGRHR